MIDSVLKGTGNSRFLKSAVPAGTSWADALAMLQAGTFPIDFNGINTEGFQQVGTPLNKANLLKDATAAQIGLPPSTTPDGMFQALGNTGELHVWRKTVTTAQEIPAGYTLGDVKTKKAISATGSGQAYIGFYMGYSDSLAVDDNGGISLNPDNDYGEVTANSNFTYISSVIAGKFILIRSYQRPDDNSYSSLAGKIFYVPADANISMTQESNYLYIRLSKCQDVTGYPLTPAGTTTTYPVSTNPNAYQEGDDAKEAGYTLGEVVTGSFSITPKNNGSQDTRWNYAADATGNITVTDDGVVSLSKVDSSVTTNGGSSNAVSTFSVLKGKYATFVYSINAGNDKADLQDMVVFFPSDAVFSQVSDHVVVDRYQPVTGYAAIPAGTTIEYLGKLGDKARVQVVSYVGTGTYGSSNPNSLTFDFVPKVILIYRPAKNYNDYYHNCMFLFNGVNTGITLAYGSGFNNVAWNNKKVSWYSDGASENQMSVSGQKYYAAAIG